MRGFRIVFAAHGELAAAILASAQMIVGTIDDAVAVGLQPDHTPEAYIDALRDAIGDGPCLVLADLDGGTPSNCACVIARRQPGVVVLAGVNLGVVIEAATSLESLGDDAVDALVNAGRNSIVNASRRLAASRP